MPTNSIYPLSQSTILAESEKLASRIKKVIVPRSMLKEIDGETNCYIVRYRILSEDRNRSSHWSPVFHIQHPPFTPSRGKTEPLGDIVSISWEDSTNRPQYDIFVKYDFDTDYRFLTTTTNRNFNIFREEGSNSLIAKVQVSATIKKVYNSLVLYESDQVLF